MQSIDNNNIWRTQRYMHISSYQEMNILGKNLSKTNINRAPALTILSLQQSSISVSWDWGEKNLKTKKIHSSFVWFEGAGEN